jgi:hypothetical protein
MKELKELVMILMVCIISIPSFGQKTYKYNNDVLTIKQKNGADVEKDMLFTLSKKDYDNIKNSEVFKNFEANPGNELYLNKHKDWDRVVLFINSPILKSLLRLKFLELKNGSSLDFINDSKGSIYINDQGEVKISYYFKSQNAIGNYITRQNNCTISMKEGEEDMTCYIK